MDVKRQVLERKRQFLAARLVQAHFRGYRCREGVCRDKAARIMQGQMRKRFRRRRAATVIQAAWLGWRSRRLFGPQLAANTATRAEKATLIQACWRGRSHRSSARKRFSAMLLLQVCKYAHQIGM